MERGSSKEFLENGVEVSRNIDQSYFLVLKALIAAADRNVSLPLLAEVTVPGESQTPEIGELLFDPLENRLQIKMGKNIYLAQDLLREKNIIVEPDSLIRLKSFLDALAKESRYTSPPYKEQEIGPKSLRISELKSMHATPYVEMIVDNVVITFIAHTLAHGWQLISTPDALKKSDRGSKACQKYGSKIFDEALKRVKEIYPDGVDPDDEISFNR